MNDAVVVSEPVELDSTAVYEFASQPDRFPQWASGLASGITRRGDHWVAQSPMGKIEIRMAPRNTFGVLDHDVRLPDGTTVHNAFRVTPTGNESSLLTFTMIRMPGTPQEAFDADVATIRKDLKALRSLLETGGTST